MSLAPEKLRILLVDDEPFVLRALSRLLREHDVHIANGYDQAVPVIRTEQLDLIVSDGTMPGLGGVDVLKAAAAFCPNAVRVMLTGTPPPEGQALVAEGVIHRLMLKPWTADIGEELVAMARRGPPKASA